MVMSVVLPLSVMVPLPVLYEELRYRR